MNTVVQAETLTINFVAKIVDVKVSTSLTPHDITAIAETVCLHTFTVLTINGHSIKAINPETLKVGELTTLEMA